MLQRRLINAMLTMVVAACILVLLSPAAFAFQQPQQPEPQQPQPPQPPQPQQPQPQQPQQQSPQTPVTPNASAQLAQPVVAVSAVAPLGPKKPGVARIGVVLPITQISQDSGLALNEAIRQLLISYLNGPAAEAVPLDARVPVQAEVEAKQKECDFVFYSAVGSRQRSSGFAKFMKAATPVVGMIPGSGATTAAAGAAGAATTTDKVMKTATDLSSTIKAKDEISVEFKLTAQGGAPPKIANVLKAKAKKDGDQVLSTLLAEAANAVLQAVMQK